MADAKNKTKPVQDFRTMDEATLQAKLAELRKELVEQHRANAAQELPSPAVIRKTRKEIAKTLTILREKRQQPVAEVKEQEK